MYPLYIFPPTWTVKSFDDWWTCGGCVWQNLKHACWSSGRTYLQCAPTCRWHRLPFISSKSVYTDPLVLRSIVVILHCWFLDMGRYHFDSYSKKFPITSKDTNLNVSDKSSWNIWLYRQDIFILFTGNIIPCIKTNANPRTGRSRCVIFPQRSTTTSSSIWHEILCSHWGKAGNEMWFCKRELLLLNFLLGFRKKHCKWNSVFQTKSLTKNCVLWCCVTSFTTQESLQLFGGMFWRHV